MCHLEISKGDLSFSRVKIRIRFQITLKSTPELFAEMEQEGIPSKFIDSQSIIPR